MNSKSAVAIKKCRLIGSMFFVIILAACGSDNVFEYTATKNWADL